MPALMSGNAMLSGPRPAAPAVLATTTGRAITAMVAIMAMVAYAAVLAVAAMKMRAVAAMHRSHLR